MDNTQPNTALTPRQSLAVGITLFSMFFGAGNLILPSPLALKAGTNCSSRASACPSLAS